MRILVVGAGALGGYFGCRLLQAKRDVTFLVRAGRAAQLRDTGLVIRSPAGDFDLPNPPAVGAGDLRQPFDLILLSCKAYDLDGAIESFAPAVGPTTAILPLLNGMRHLERLEARFGPQSVLGGVCLISAALDAQGRILHLNEAHRLSFGERNAASSPRAQAILAEFTGARFDASLSESILQSMWEKWVFIATLAGITCLMRAAVADIVAVGEAALPAELYEECAAIAAEAGYPPGPQMRQLSLGVLALAGSPMTASMLRDLESGGRIEADHILGDLLRRRKSQSGLSLLAIAHAHVKAYEARRQREAPAQRS